MEISVQVGVKVNEKEKYNMSLRIPGQNPSLEEPFHFMVEQESDNQTECVMQIAFADKEHIYLEVKPPKSILEKAKVDEYIDKLAAVVKEGDYNVESGKFLAIEQTEEASE